MLKKPTAGKMYVKFGIKLVESNLALESCTLHIVVPVCFWLGISQICVEDRSIMERDSWCICQAMHFPKKAKERATMCTTKRHVVAVMVLSKHGKLPKELSMHVKLVSHHLLQSAKV
jgi:hypothetical protein